MKGLVVLGAWLAISACGSGNANEEATQTPVPPLVPPDSMALWCAMLVDTLLASHAGEEDTAFYRTAVLHMETGVAVPGSWRYPGYTSEVASRFHVQQLNHLKAVWIEYGGDRLFGPNEIHCYVTDADHRVKARMIFGGCHYHNGVLEVVDLEQDGTDELRYTLVEPVQSVPVIRTFSEYYSLVADSLVLKFTITTDERRTGVAFEPGKGEWITRAYRYDVDEGTISVNERTYGFAPDDFKFDEEIKPRTLMTKATYRFRYEPDSLRYVRVKT